MCDVLSHTWSTIEWFDTLYLLHSIICKKKKKWEIEKIKDGKIDTQSKKGKPKDKRPNFHVCVFAFFDVSFLPLYCFFFFFFVVLCFFSCVNAGVYDTIDADAHIWVDWLETLNSFLKLTYSKFSLWRTRSFTSVSKCICGQIGCVCACCINFRISISIVSMRFTFLSFFFFHLLFFSLCGVVVMSMMMLQLTKFVFESIWQNLACQIDILRKYVNFTIFPPLQSIQNTWRYECIDIRVRKFEICCAFMFHIARRCIAGLEFGFDTSKDD